jgi:hypothetical protein
MLYYALTAVETVITIGTGREYSGTGSAAVGAALALTNTTSAPATPLQV